MPETADTPPYPVEVCRVLTAEQTIVNGALVVRCTVNVSDAEQECTVTVPEDGVAVLRYLGVSDMDEDARVEIVGDASRLDDNHYALAGRSGGLRVIDRERAHTMALYLNEEGARLERLKKATANVVKLAQSNRRRPGAAVTDYLMASELLRRQRILTERICAIATYDEMTGVFKPETARERALHGIKFDV